MHHWLFLILLSLIFQPAYAGEDNVPGEFDGSRKPLYEYKRPDPYKDKELLKEGNVIDKLDPADRFFISVEDQVQDKLRCKITPILNQPPANIPQNFNKTNNLRRKSSSPLVAEGDVVFIKGQIRDINCVPVFNAIVEMWSLNAVGIDQAGKPKYIEGYDKNFVGSGTTTTDNLGNFEFITILPGSDGANAPQLNFRIRHEHFPLTYTSIYFDNVEFNKYDAKLRKLTPKNQRLLIAEIAPVNTQDPDEGEYVTPVIILNGINEYRKF